jgi:diguanylate cyclase (GGDEF)-like protein/PAS domain S-box-containing protein
VDAPREAVVAPGGANDLGEWALLAVAAMVSLAGLLVAQRARTDRSKARVEKEQVDQRLRNTVENAPVGMTLVDLGHRFVEPNKRLCQMLGYSAEELTRLTFQDVTHAEDMALDMALLDQLIAGEIESYELEKRYVQQDGSLLWGRLAVSVLRDETGGLAYFVSQIEDVTEVRKARTDLQHRALYDPLTGLANRSLLMDRLTMALGNERNPVNVGVGFCDLDHFKSINDTHGHQVGDEVLTEVARRLQESVRAEDTVARLGGDEFVIVLHDVTSPEEATTVLDRASRAVREPMVIGGLTLRTSLSVGLAIAAHGDDPDVLLRDADAAMYAAKKGGRGRIQSAPLTPSVRSASRV